MTNLHDLALALAQSLTGPWGAYLKNRLGAAQQATVDSVLRSLQRRISRVESRLRTDAFDSGDLAELVLRMIRVAEGTLRQERVDLAAEVIARFLRHDEADGRVSFDQAEFLMNVAQTLPLEAFRVLAVATSQVRNKLGKLEAGESVSIDFRRLRSELGGLDPDYLMGLIGELDRFNLLRRGNPPFVAMGEKYDGYGLDLTPIGLQLVEILRDLEEESEDG